MSVIVLDGVHRTYRLDGDVAVPTLRGVSQAFDRGDFVAVMGPSGSGKSTLIHIPGCLDRPDRGCYLLDGEDVAALAPDELAAVR